MQQLYGSRCMAMVPRVLARNYQIKSTTRKVLPVYPVLESKSSDIIKQLSLKDLSTLDPQATRRKLIDRHDKDCIKAGDVVRVVYDASKCNRSTVVGYVLSVDRKQLIQDCSLLLRNHINKTAVEMRIPVFSPLIDRIDLIRRADGKRRRNKHYYIRNTRLDVGDLDAGLKKRK
ncbi:mitochondrial 54S ribosomal protein bL19m Ecym_2103 [Eremothecium cymbalariae DBVPG|uniref:Ribosomal protein L19 n=1 Tax=Eremothecium cymbalariae (strain CBS 270.75 / DBVPG 7215 / KCTC 17166 / NRRL Y-17582) TaxID=931890 RepID=G8JPK7_ERECY|nr:Hypothetical protein Ecym_2103 [Eremothecium cymbalariae DBVPG\